MNSLFTQELKGIFDLLKGNYKEIIVISLATLFLMLHKYHLIEPSWFISPIGFWGHITRWIVGSTSEKRQKGRGSGGRQEAVFAQDSVLFGGMLLSSSCKERTCFLLAATRGAPHQVPFAAARILALVTGRNIAFS